MRSLWLRYWRLRLPAVLLIRTSTSLDRCSSPYWIVTQKQLFVSIPTMVRNKKFSLKSTSKTQNHPQEQPPKNPSRIKQAQTDLDYQQILSTQELKLKFSIESSKEINIRLVISTWWPIMVWKLLVFLTALRNLLKVSINLYCSCLRLVPLVVGLKFWVFSINRNLR